MDRRTLVIMMATGVANPLLQGAGAAQPAPKARRRRALADSHLLHRVQLDETRPKTNTQEAFHV